MGNVLTSFLEKEFASSPFPVLQSDKRAWRRMCKIKGLQFHGHGACYVDMKQPGLPTNLIVIDDSLPNYQQIAVFYHELTHAECSINKCECFSGPESICEYHAQVGALEKCLNQSLIKSIRFTMASICALSWNADLSANMTMRHPIWQKCRHLILSGTVAPLSDMLYNDAI